MDLRLHRLLSLVAAAVLLPKTAVACPICFGSVDSPLLDSARLGVLAMAALTLCVLATFGAWFVRLARLEAAQSAADNLPIEEHSTINGRQSGDPQSPARIRP